MSNYKLNGYIAWISVCIIWGTTYLAIRIGVAHIPPMLFAGIRWIVAGIIFISALKLSGKKLPPLKDLKHIAVMGLLMLGFGNGLVVTGEQYISSGLAALLITTVPFWIVGFDSLAVKKSVFNKFIISGLLLGLVGVSAIFGDNWKDLFNKDYLIGVLSILGAVIAWSLGSVYSKHKKINAHPLMSAAVQMLVAGIAQTLLGIILGEISQVKINQEGIYSLSYLIVFGSILGYGSYIYAIEHLPLSLVSTYAYINPIIAVFLGWFVLNEKLNFYMIIAAILIIAGVMLVKKGSEVNLVKKLSGTQSST
ncbi:DMT superfamily drug/metabolite permease [Ignavibacterium album JCM 16511]|uniref:DMT superfamily drug/metabolite permease n=1 Tax=Ignavibacterium album (strain DSM 19864 / JCM 16511 / NBRC 101810 / Mat9-16) TaxID=945713 RepID=I0AMV0_IGNAJ|nr:EamA family transporter [Ignavibacterium album]AFH50307.1 DMT superfamily drug/metabolite permease [Ignavibacterium album JCM 16511]